MRSAASWTWTWTCPIKTSGGIKWIAVFVAVVFVASGAIAQNTWSQSASAPANTNNAQNQQRAPSQPSSSQPSTSQPASSQPSSTQPASGNPNDSDSQSAPNQDLNAQEPTAQQPSSDDQGMFVFKKQVEEVVLHATVYDEERRLVTGLDRSAFQVVENGVPQAITSFRREDVPVEIGVVIDNSGSMREKRDEINRAVLNLIRASNPHDQVFVVNFGRNPYLDQDFTSDVNLLEAALHQVSAKGSTALYDAIVASAVHLKNNASLDKRVLLVITDGQDNMSRDSLEDASRQVQQANGPVLYTIGLLGSGMEENGRNALQRLADETGGVAYFPDSLSEVDSITRTIAHDIRSQYMIAYKPQNQNARPGYQSVQVLARAPGYGRLTVRTKTGYYPPARQ
jgi:Ca-activated chloride channel homolog